jgi:hypothetical protein
MSDFTFYSMIVWTAVVVVIGLTVATIKHSESHLSFLGFWLIVTAILWLVGFFLWASVQIKQHIDDYGLPFTGSG